MNPTSPLFLWLPLIAVSAHLVEEFVWPGGFAKWYRWYRPERAASVTTRFLVITNAVYALLALLPITLGATPRGFAYWLIVAAIAAANGVFHLWATLRRGVYSPGVVTGALAYLPLAALGYVRLVSTGAVSKAVTVEAIVIGVGYHLWSAWNHKRRAAAAFSS